LLAVDITLLDTRKRCWKEWSSTSLARHHSPAVSLLYLCFRLMSSLMTILSKSSDYKLFHVLCITNSSYVNTEQFLRMHKWRSILFCSVLLFNITLYTYRNEHWVLYSQL